MKRTAMYCDQCRKEIGEASEPYFLHVSAGDARTPYRLDFCGQWCLDVWKMGHKPE